MSMNPAYRMQECGLCRRRWPQSKSVRSTINGRNAWICGICEEAIEKGERDATAVRQASEQRGRKR